MPANNAGGVVKIVRTADEQSYRLLATENLRRNFLVEDLFQKGRVELAYTDVDRAIVGGIVPVDAPLSLQAGREMACSYFCERREMGILNLGAAGTVAVDRNCFTLMPRECLYVGRGSRDVRFSSVLPDDPAFFYLVSYPAHTAFPVTHAGMEQANRIELGSQKEANRRTICQYIHPNGIASCQLVMGFTELHEGSVWNTFPPHTHDRRTEVYCYFDLPPQGCVFHLMGLPNETRHIVLREKQAVLSPPWSVHSGVGTGSYRFVWAMGGENQVFDDMDPVNPNRLK
jgi:4-deoxy-L-threo-5-hexosulose-uronate ketol-isomerase